MSILRIGARLEFREVAHAITVRIHERVVGISWVQAVLNFPAIRQTVLVGVLVQAKDLTRLVAAVVESLPPEQREVVVLKEYQGLTFLEIAETLDVPISTVKTRLYRGLGQLRVRLERQGIRAAPPLPAWTP